MAKVKSSYFCSECGYESPGWLGKCPGCGQWNTLVESHKVTGKPTSGRSTSGVRNGWLQSLTDQAQQGCTPSNPKLGSPAGVLDWQKLESGQELRFSSGIPELDRVLGGGFVPGSLLLIGGDPGIGKSTLLLQVCQAAHCGAPILYVCGEESPAQIKLRGERLGIHREGLKLLPETRFEKIAEVLALLRPKLAIIDSIQTIYTEEGSSVPGSVTQIRDCSAGFLRLAKALGITLLLIGHVTKEGGIAGPRILEHMVDAVLYFEGENQNSLRIVRGVKNRFGTTNEIGIFEMTQEGLIPLPDPSEMVLAGRPTRTPGAALTATLEGTRPLILELQSLLNPTQYGMPQRMTQGVDRNRMSLLLAVGDKFLRAGFQQMDAYLNVVGGFRLQDTAADLAALAALLSASRGIPLPENTLILGELGLTGELRPVARIEERIREANRLGFKQVILPSANRKSCKQALQKLNIDLIFVDNLNQAVDVLFGSITRSESRKKK